MTNSLDAIPEIRAWNARETLIRIPGEQDVPITPRIRRLIDSPPMRRLAALNQLGLVSLVYPGATHSRFEHSLGVYRMTLLFLNRLATDSRFAECISTDDAQLLIVAALMHDIGHWPYCHPFEDMGLTNIPTHESMARQRLNSPAVASILKDEFGISPDAVADLLEGTTNGDSGQAILSSILSGPVDVDKMDYLYRDSLHAGVPYGLHFDQGRLIGSLCLNEAGNKLAITEKGCTAAELMVFARYVMFSEVYWHHTVRGATAMLQRAFFTLHESLPLETLFDSTDHSFHQSLLQSAENTTSAKLVEGLFGPVRKIYKRIAQFNVLEHAELFEKISRRPYDWLVKCSDQLVVAINQNCGTRLEPGDILIDAPPAGLEVQFRINVKMKDGKFRQLDEVSPVVRSLAQDQFDNYVKRVRVFVNPDARSKINLRPDEIAELLITSIQGLGS